MTPVHGPFCPHCKREDPIIGKVLAGLYRAIDRHAATIHTLSTALLRADPVAWQATQRQFDSPQPRSYALGDEAGAGIPLGAFVGED